MAKTSDGPRISVNKLAEFTTARAQRQRQILRDQKYPTDFKGMYHREAAEAVAHCLASNLEDTDVLDRAISILDQMEPEKIGTQRRIAANVDALETFRAMLDDVDLRGAAPELGPPSPRKLTVQNVAISVRPEILLRAAGRNGAALVGAVKLHFPRTFSLNDDAAGYASALLQEWCKAALPDDGAAHGPLCYVIDVGAKRVCAGVKSTAQRMRDIDACCRNIAALWPAITPAADG